VADYIQKHLQENISVKALSREAYMSEPHFFRCFKQQFGISPIDYINEQRIRVAKMMLQAADYSITEISFASGFNNLNYFLKMFKRHTGLTPAQYRKSLLL
jgi:AraC-like DNA-binding protein